MGLVFTNIQHEFRKKHKLTCNEYVLADMVYQLCLSPKSLHPGWCYMSRPEIAEEIGLSKQSVLNLIDSLILKGIIIKNPNNFYIKTNEIWYDTVFTEGVKKVYRGGKESLPHGGKESLPNNNNLDNYIDNNNDELKNSSDLYKLFVEYWLKEFHVGWTFTAVHGKAVKALIGKIKKILKDAGREFSDQEILDFFKAMCQRLPEWYKEKDLMVLDSKFNEIISEIKSIKNGKPVTIRQHSSVAYRS